MDKTSVIFCVGALALSLAVAILAFPYAAMPAAEVARAATPQPAEALGSVEVGGGFGRVPVTKLMDYYIDNPPAPATASAAPAAPRLHFGGC